MGLSVLSTESNSIVGGQDGISVQNAYDFKFDVILEKDIFNPTNMTIFKACVNRKCLVVISETISKIYGHNIIEYFTTNFQPDMCKIITIKTTEKNKNIDNIMHICSEAKKFSMDRKSLMVAIGGGILMDMVGFAASMYKRKIDYIRIPTTLVGQIDAGIGIKTGINFEDSKNFLGAFYPPSKVINDITLLKTLDRVEISCGLAEIIKMAIIVDAYLFELIERNWKGIFEIKELDANSVEWEINKIAIVRMLEQLDVNFYEKELERLVDFGHTFSPFIEEYSDYTINHGLAVAMDIAISTEIAFLMNKISMKSKKRILDLLLNLNLNIYNERTYNDKLMWKSLKNILLHRGNKLNLVIPHEIGHARFVRDLNEISEDLLKEALSNLKEYQEIYKEDKHGSRIGV
ncbi:TPA: sedoheptulose 7-phosphate cyclase [Bacillus cereus]|nr:sedoheptulose 7-phosphate cyclase [Bacillus cereus]